MGAASNRTLWGTLAIFLALACAAGATATARQAADKAQSGTDVYTISDNVDLVLLDVSVKDPHGGYALGLTRSNFRVYEDGHAREITHFASVDTPVTVGLVVDNSGSMRLKRPEVVLAGLSFAKQSNPKDEFFVVNFNNFVLRGLRSPKLFTDNIQALHAALYYGEPNGQTALYDAVAYALKLLEFSHRDKRTLVVVSDGGDNVSKTSFPELMRLVEASRATIYTVGLYDPADRDLNPGILRKMSSVSGGEFFRPEKLNDVVRVFSDISKNIRNCYTLGFVPDEVHDKRTVRSVKVVAVEGNRKLAVRTRTTYINAPLAALIAEQGSREAQARDQ